MPSYLVRSRPLGGAILAGFTIALAGCGIALAPRSEAPPSSLTEVPAVTSRVLAPTRQTVQPGKAVSISALIALAIERTPTRAIFRANRRASQAAITQARAWPNPEIGAEGGPARTTAGEHTMIARIELRQRFELPNKRSSRVHAAEAGAVVAEAEQRTWRLDLVGDVSATAVEIAVDQQAVSQAMVTERIAHDVLDGVQRRVNAGDIFNNQ